MDRDKAEGQGFRQIGGLMPMIEKKLENRDIPMNKSTDTSARALSITGSPYRDNGGLSSVGGRHGGIIPAPTLPAVRLADTHPIVVDKKLRERLPPRVASLINTAEIINNDFEVIGYKPLNISPSEALVALEETDQFYHPAPYDLVIKGLARARAMTKRRSEQADDEEIALAAYAELFFPYPADVTAAVLAKLHKLDGGWWPAAATVERQLEIYGRGRLALRQALLAVEK